MSIFVSKPGEEEFLLFKFAPGSRAGLPDVSVDRQTSSILISVREIGSVYSRADRWRDMDVTYDIGTVDYPDASPDAR